MPELGPYASMRGRFERAFPTAILQHETGPIKSALSTFKSGCWGLTEHNAEFGIMFRCSRIPYFIMFKIKPENRQRTHQNQAI
jgi:hypothetical protein